jgi:GGDEF domain-containing protein
VASVRASDTVARLAGDEFVIVFEQVASEDEAARLAAKIVAAVRSRFRWKTRRARSPPAWAWPCTKATTRPARN